MEGVEGVEGYGVSDVADGADGTTILRVSVSASERKTAQLDPVLPASASDQIEPVAVWLDCALAARPTALLLVH